MGLRGAWRSVLAATVLVAGGCDEVADGVERRPAALVGDDAASVCQADALALCDAECVDLRLDPRHCGGCGRWCAGSCVAGSCEQPCARDQVRCGGVCVDRSRVPPGGGRREFEFTGAPQSFVVPDCVSQVTVELWGAQGGGSQCCDDSVQDDGGRGAYVRARLEVAPGEVLRIFVGGPGGVDGAAGYNGGGAGGTFAGGGGGASDLRRGGDGLDDRILVAGGGGGGQCGCPDHGEGGGGGLVGEPGIAALPEWQAAGGGTLHQGGAAGSAPGEAGAFGVGGGSGTYHVGGGGGGWYGGGSAYAAGAGGGSSYLGDDPEALAMPAIREGEGRVTITW